MSFSIVPCREVSWLRCTYDAVLEFVLHNKIFQSLSTIKAGISGYYLKNDILSTEYPSEGNAILLSVHIVSGILMESRKLVTLSLTLLKRMLCPRNDSPVLTRFHSHWTRQLVEFPRSITIVSPRFNSL